MLLRTTPSQARRRISQTFFSMLDGVLPEQLDADIPYYDALSRARALKEAVFEAVLEQYAVPAPSSLAGEDECDVCSGAD